MYHPVLAALAAVCLFVIPGSARADIHGAGASFPSKVYARWAAEFEAASKLKVNYRPTGSGDGLKQISQRSVDFAGSDSPLPATELSKRRLVQIPMVVGGIVPVVNLPGVADATLQLDGPVLADIVRGAITRWDDARIAELNPGRALPALPIRRVVRADKSGTTEGYTRYLAQVSAPFRAEVGSSQLPKWPGPVTAGEGNDGVADAVKRLAGAIGYVSYDRVARGGLAGVRLKNASGRYVRASELGFRAAITESDLARKGDDLAPLIDRPGPDAWPITLTTFALVDASPTSARQAEGALRFLYWCYMHGDDLTKGTGFAPLPVTVQSRLAARFASVKAQDLAPLHYIAP